MNSKVSCQQTAHQTVGLSREKARRRTFPMWKNRLCRLENWAGVMLSRPVLLSSTAPVAAWYAASASVAKFRAGRYHAKSARTRGKEDQRGARIGDTGSLGEDGCAGRTIGDTLVNTNELVCRCG